MTEGGKTTSDQSGDAGGGKAVPPGAQPPKLARGIGGEIPARVKEGKGRIIARAEPRNVGHDHMALFGRNDTKRRVEERARHDALTPCAASVEGRKRPVREDPQGDNWLDPARRGPEYHGKPEGERRHLVQRQRRVAPHLCRRGHPRRPAKCGVPLKCEGDEV